MIASGQIIDSGITIKPVSRYISDKGDTLTVFSIQSERLIAYGLQQLNDCKDEVEFANTTITAADSLIGAKEKTNYILVHEKENLKTQGAIKDNIIVTYKQEVISYKKQIKTLKKQKVLLAISTTSLLILSTYLIVR